MSYGFHDWAFVLGEFGLLVYDETFAAMVLIAGRLIRVGALAWGALLLWKAWSDHKAA